MQTTLPTGVKVYADSLRDQLVHGSTGFSQTREQRARARARISNSHAATMPLYLETSTLDASVDPHSLYSVAMKRKAFKERKESEKKRQEEKVMQLREIRRRETEAEFLRTKEAVARKIKEKDEQFHAMLRNLDAERPFVDSIEAFIREHEQDELRRKEKLYLEWMQEVYLPIQQQIEEALGAVTTAQIEAKRREMFEEFLKNSNRNHGVFRDIIQEEIYDPFKLTRTAPKYSVQRIRDPCKKELQKKSEETMASAELTVGEGSLRKSLIAAASLIASAPASAHSQSSSPPGSPDRLRPSVWDKADCIPEVRYESPTSPTDLALGSGPSSPSLARFSESAAPARATRSFGKGRPQRSQSSSPSSELGQSRVVLDHFQYAKDQAVVKAEYFSKGKRVFAGRSQAETQAPLPESSE